MVFKLNKRRSVEPLNYEEWLDQIDAFRNVDIKFPDFPPLPKYKPKFPASDSIKLKIRNYSNVWIKDESSNPTGTHKDRMAHEIAIKYKFILKNYDLPSKPRLSIISSGSAAIAIQNMLNIHKLPALKVLVDKNLDASTKRIIREYGAELYEVDLSMQMLSSDTIKVLTNNSYGIDITYREVINSNNNYYDWLGYEILNLAPEYCFIPFGTGDLFSNVINILKREQFNSFQNRSDPRFFGDIKQLSKCHFIGGTTNSPNSNLKKLYAPFSPKRKAHYSNLYQTKLARACGKYTRITKIHEKWVGAAMKIANENNIECEPSGAAGIALFLQMSEMIPLDAKIVIVNTGKVKF